MKAVVFAVLTVSFCLGAVAPLRGQSACAVNHALHFDGTDDFVIVPHHPSINFDQMQAFTVEAWVRAPALALPWPAGPAPIGTVLEKWNGTCATPYPYALRVHTPAQPVGVAYDAVQCTVAGGLVAGSAGLLADGRWHHIAYVRTAQLVSSLYFDGVLAGVSFQPPLADTRNQVPLYIGRRGPGGPFTNYFEGDIDEIRISTVARYSANFRPSPHSDPDPATVLLLHFDEGQGFLAADSSGNANHGLLGAAVGPVPPVPTWIANTLPAASTGLASSVNGGPFDSGFKLIWDNDVLRYGIDAACLPALIGMPYSVFVNFGPDAALTGVTPPPATGVPAIAGFHAVNGWSSPPGFCYVAPDGLGLAGFGFGQPTGLAPAFIGDPPTTIPIPSGFFPPGLDFRMQALYLAPDVPALLVGVTNEIRLRTGPHP